MKWIKYCFRLLSYYLVQTVLFLAKKLKKIAKCRDICESFIASAALGQASRAYDRKKYDSVLSIVEPYMEVEDDYNYGFLKYYLGLLYYHGYAVNKDNVLADKYFIESANLGNEDAIQYLSDKSKYEKKH